MLENSIYSVISPEGCASILYKDSARAAEAAENLHLTAEDAKMLGIIEEIIPEDEIGTDAFYAGLKKKLTEELRVLSADPELVQKRYERFRVIGREFG